MKLLVRLRRLACRNQPGEKSEFKIRREADAQPSQWRTTMSKASRQQQGKKDATLNAKAPKRQARGSHRPQGEGNQRRSQLRITNPDAAGIDIGSQVHYVAVPEERAERTVRSFGAYTTQLDEIAHWLKECAVKTVAMESTGFRYTRSSKRLVLKCCWSMRGKPSMCLDVKATSRIAKGYSSCTPTGCYERRFVLKIRFVAYAPCNDIARTWSNVRGCLFSTCRRRLTR